MDPRGAPAVTGYFFLKVSHPEPLEVVYLRKKEIKPNI